MSRKRQRLGDIREVEKKKIKLIKSENRVEKKNSELEYFRKILDDKFKKEEELIHCKNTIKEKDEKHVKVMQKHEIEKRNCLNELLQSKNECEELRDSIRINSEKLHLVNKKLQDENTKFQDENKKLQNENKEQLSKVEQLCDEKSKLDDLTTCQTEQLKEAKAQQDLYMKYLENEISDHQYSKTKLGEVNKNLVSKIQQLDEEKRKTDDLIRYQNEQLEIVKN